MNILVINYLNKNSYLKFCNVYLYTNTLCIKVINKKKINNILICCCCIKKYYLLLFTIMMMMMMMMMIY